jgi:hypothetical protein
MIIYTTNPGTRHPRPIRRVDEPALFGFSLHRSSDSPIPTVTTTVKGSDGRDYTIHMTSEEIDAAVAARDQHIREFNRYSEVAE